MDKFTPGPWSVSRAQHSGHCYVYSPCNEYIQLYCMVGNRQNSLENAKLISKAPEMLKLLREIKSLYNNLDDVPYWIESINHLEREIAGLEHNEI